MKNNELYVLKCAIKDLENELKVIPPDSISFKLLKTRINRGIELYDRLRVKHGALETQDIDDIASFYQLSALYIDFIYA